MSERVQRREAQVGLERLSLDGPCSHSRHALHWQHETNFQTVKPRIHRLELWQTTQVLQPRYSSECVKHEGTGVEPTLVPLTFLQM